MNKVDWVQLHKILKDIYSRFLEDYSDFRNGRNAKIRKEGERQVYNHIDLAKYWIQKSPDSLNLLFPDGANDYGKAIIWGEFIRPNYFKKDMPGYLKSIKEKIESDRNS